MALPKLTQPEFEITLPVIKKKVKFRPFLVSEEKVLLVGKEGSPAEQMNAIVQILESVVLTKNFSARDLTSVDLEYLFMHLRAKSVNNIVKLKYKDNEDESVYDFELDINDIEPTFTEGRSNVIKIENYNVEVREPTIGIMEKVGLGLDSTEDMTEDNVSQSQMEALFNLLAHCLVKVYDDKQVYDDFTIEEAVNFFKDVSIKDFEKVQEYFDSAPKLTHELEYTNKKGNNRKIVLRGLQDFF